MRQCWCPLCVAVVGGEGAGGTWFPACPLGHVDKLALEEEGGEQTPSFPLGGAVPPWRPILSAPRHTRQKLPPDRYSNQR